MWRPGEDQERRARYRSVSISVGGEYRLPLGDVYTWARYPSARGDRPSYGDPLVRLRMYETR